MAIEIRSVAKTYSDGKRALAGIDLDVPDGIFGLLGPNGAGKSSLIRILAGVLEPSGGEVRVDGRPLRELRGGRPFRHRLGYLPQEFRALPHLDAIEYLEYCLRFYDGAPSRRERRRRIDALVEQVGLERAARRRTAGYSKGMMRRLGIAQALLHEPDILIVDEPTAGLDPEERVRFRNLIAEFAEGRSILLSTHIVGDIEVLCSRIAVIDRGTVAFRGTPTSLMERIVGCTWERDVAESALAALLAAHPAHAVGAEGERVRVRLVAAEPAPGDVAVEPTMEDAYLALVREFAPPADAGAA